MRDLCMKVQAGGMDLYLRSESVRVLIISSMRTCAGWGSTAPMHTLIDCCISLVVWTLCEQPPRGGSGLPEQGMASGSHLCSVCVLYGCASLPLLACWSPTYVALCSWAGLCRLDWFTICLRLLVEIAQEVQPGNYLSVMLHSRHVLQVKKWRATADDAPAAL
jgi:hypothetical protein